MNDANFGARDIDSLKSVRSIFECDVLICQSRLHLTIQESEPILSHNCICVYVGHLLSIVYSKLNFSCNTCSRPSPINNVNLVQSLLL